MLDGEAEFPGPEIAGSAAAQALPSGPAFPYQNNQTIFVALVHGAQQQVVPTTPYFVPDEPLLQAIQTAALRGVNVHLVVSAEGDNAVVLYAQESYYEELLEAGVNIHVFQSDFLLPGRDAPIGLGARALLRQLAVVDAGRLVAAIVRPKASPEPGKVTKPAAINTRRLNNVLRAA